MTWRNRQANVRPSRNRAWSADNKAIWMRRFEAAVLAVRPELSGRLDWDSATYYHSTGINPIEAAGAYLRARD